LHFSFILSSPPPPPDALYRSHIEQCNPWLPQQHSGVLRLPWRALHDLCLRVAHPDQPNPDTTPIDVPLDLPGKTLRAEIELLLVSEQN
jgi:hypothetical protein